MVNGLCHYRSLTKPPGIISADKIIWFIWCHWHSFGIIVKKKKKENSRRKEALTYKGPTVASRTKSYHNLI